MLLAIGLAVLLPASSALAGTPAECTTRIQKVYWDLGVLCGSGAIGGNNATRTCDSLKSKLTNAKTKIDQLKYLDARQKLRDFIDSVGAMATAAKPKLTQEDANTLLFGQPTESDPLNEGAWGAHDCVNSLL